MSAGKATPTDARMMWKPSVNAIWLRAASSCEASITTTGGSASRHAGLGFFQAGLELLGAGAVDVRDGLCGGGQQRRCEQAHDEPGPSAKLRALAAQVVSGLDH